MLCIDKLKALLELEETGGAYDLQLLTLVETACQYAENAGVKNFHPFDDTETVDDWESRVSPDVGLKWRYLQIHVAQSFDGASYSTATQMFVDGEINNILYSLKLRGDF